MSTVTACQPAESMARLDVSHQKIKWMGFRFWWGFTTDRRCFVVARDDNRRTLEENVSAEHKAAFGLVRIFVVKLGASYHRLGKESHRNSREEAVSILASDQPPSIVFGAFIEHESSLKSTVLDRNVYPFSDRWLSIVMGPWRYRIAEKPL